MRKRHAIKTTTVQDAVKVYLDHRASQAISPKTCRFEATALNVIVKEFGDKPLSTVTKDALVKLFQARREAGNSVNTTRHFLTVTRRWFVFLIEQGLSEDNPAMGVPLPKPEQKPIQPMSREQVQALFNAMDTTRFSGQRNQTILKLLYDTGMRVGEALGIRLVDVELSHRRISVYGKGRKSRTVYISDAMASALRVYLSRRGTVANNLYLFPDEYGTGALEYSSFQHAIYRANEIAKIEGVRVSAHTLRHSFAREWCLGGGDIASLSLQLGHSDLQVTSRYVTMLSDDRAEIQQRVSPLEKLGGHQQKRKRL